MRANVAKSSVSALMLAAGGVALLCLMDGVIKHLVTRYDVLAVTFGRYVFAALFASAVWMRAGRPTMTIEMLRAHSLRGAVIAVSAFSFFWSLSVLPLAEVVALSFVAPLLIPFFARVMLGERINPRSVVACVLGFAGVLVANTGAPSDDGGAMRMFGVVAILVAAVTYALSITLLRARAGRDGAAIVGLLAAAIPGAFLALPAIASSAPPLVADVPAFALMGALGAGGMYLLVIAYARAEAQTLAPLEYTALIWAAAMGLAFFDETPRFEVFAGAAIIIFACLWSARPAISQAGPPTTP